jgi:hypothetical protein
MSQLHFYVPDTIAKAVQHKADEAGLSISRYIAELVKRDVGSDHEWPTNYFDQVFGQWEGAPLERAPQGDYEQRPTLD